jgi:hypothetical protein
MDPSNDGDGEHFVVQLNGSERSPRAPKVTSISLHLDVGTDKLYSNETIFRQTFTPRRYKVERDGRLTSLAKAIEWVPRAQSALSPIE